MLRYDVCLALFLEERFIMTAKLTVRLCQTSAALVLLAPVFALIAVVIKCDSRGPLFFRQQRVGRDGKPFRDW